MTATCLFGDEESVGDPDKPLEIWCVCSAVTIKGFFCCLLLQQATGS